MLHLRLSNVRQLSPWMMLEKEAAIVSRTQRQPKTSRIPNKPTQSRVDGIADGHATSINYEMPSNLICLSCTITSFDKESSHVRLESIIACLRCKIAYTSIFMRDCVGLLGI